MPLAAVDPAASPVPTPTRVIRRAVASPLTPVEVLRTFRHDDRPFCLVGAWAGGGAVVGSEPVRVADDETGDDPFELLGSLPVVDGPPGTVAGGWFGYLGYGLGRAIERLPPPPPRPTPIPRWSLAYHDHLLHWDGGTRAWWFEALWTAERADELERRHEELSHRLAGAAPHALPFGCGPFTIRPPRAHHIGVVADALESIRAGDIYQANLCLRLEATLDGSALDLFGRGATLLEPRYGAYIARPGSELASFSPELFLRRVGREVRSSPIKGTRPRSADERRASFERDQLERSAKDQAENVMIVDLVRNDLGRVCEPGSIAVPRLARPEAHPGVWHLVSDVTGTLAAGRDDGDLVRATFPPGSVTGAPKIRAMEIIAELETTDREAYTGAIGFASPVAGLELNVAIRTFERRADTIWLGVGGGVVVDSTPVGEYDECLVKARPLLEAVGADGLTDQDDRQASVR